MTQPASELKAICHCQPTGSPLEDWLRNIRDVQRLHAEELTAISDPEQKVRRPSSARVLPPSSAYDRPTVSTRAPCCLAGAARCRAQRHRAVPQYLQDGRSAAATAANILRQVRWRLGVKVELLISPPLPPPFPYSTSNPIPAPAPAPQHRPRASLGRLSRSLACTRSCTTRWTGGSSS